MKATVLPRKQLEYVLKKHDYAEDSYGRWVYDINSTKHTFYPRMFRYCGACIEFEEGYFKDGKYLGLESKRYDWNQEWFVPNSFKGN